MYIFNLKNIGFSNPSIDEMTVMGHFIYVNHTSFYNGVISNKDHWINLDARNKEYESEMDRVRELGLAELVSHLCEVIFPLSCQWGDDEQDYQYASVSGKWQLRKMVALNGRYLKALSKDPSCKVRIAVIATVSKRMDSKSSDKDKSIDYLDDMLSDENLDVRRALAKLGITKHLKSLLQDEDSRVVDNAIAYANPKHLEVLAKSLPYHVRFAIARNEHSTIEHLKALSKDVEPTVQYAIARRGVVTKSLINSENAGVRAMVAKFGSLSTIEELVSNGWGVKDNDWKVRQEVANRGFGHTLLCNDAEKVVRLAVAENANGCILNKLLNDISAVVADTASRRLRGEKKALDKYAFVGQHYFHESCAANKEHSVLMG